MSRRTQRCKPGAACDPWEHAPHLVVSEADDPLQEILDGAGRLLARHPVTAQAVFAAFVAEGRRFASRPEGKRWKAALANSEFVRRGRALWESSALKLLEDHADTVIPSAVFDAIVQALSDADPGNALLSRLGLEDGDGKPNSL